MSDLIMTLLFHSIPRDFPAALIFDAWIPFSMPRDFRRNLPGASIFRCLNSTSDGWVIRFFLIICKFLLLIRWRRRVCRTVRPVRRLTKQPPTSPRRWPLPPQAGTHSLTSWRPTRPSWGRRRAHSGIFRWRSRVFNVRYECCLIYWPFLFTLFYFLSISILIPLSLTLYFIFVIYLSSLYLSISICVIYVSLT